MISKLGTLAAALCLLAVGADAAAPSITHTGAEPTGYTVTFSYRAPAASRVQIRGEWFFARPGELQQLASTPEYTVETQGILPPAWQPGDVPVVYPNSTGPNWPVADMHKDDDGVWTYTTPLPAGVFTYGFYVDCEDPALSGCQRIPDPDNLPWNERDGTSRSERANTSQVYVPSDPAFNSIDFSWQAPNQDHGQLAHLRYTSAGHLDPEDENYLVVYTPPGYDAERAEPYPTLYLNHGGGGNEMDWSTQGQLGNIVDNLIVRREIQPIVVMPPVV